MKLQEIANAKSYNELVKDVAWNQQREPEYFSSYKEQLGFGTLNFFRLKTALYNGKNKAIIDIGERLKEMKLKGSYFCLIMLSTHNLKING